MSWQVAKPSLADIVTFVGRHVCKAELQLCLRRMLCPTCTEHPWSHGVVSGVEDGTLSVREMTGYRKELSRSSPVVAYTFEV